MTIYKAAMRGVPEVLQDGATSGVGTIIAIPPSFHNHKLIIRGSAGVSAGAVQPANYQDPSQTLYAEIGGGPITVPDDDEIEYSWQGEATAIGCPITTTVVDGTVTVTYVGS